MCKNTRAVLKLKIIYFSLVNLKFHCAKVREHRFCKCMKTQVTSNFCAIILAQFLLLQGVCNSRSCCVTHKNRSHSIYHSLNVELNCLEKSITIFCHLSTYMQNNSYVNTCSNIFFCAVQKCNYSKCIKGSLLEI